MTSLSDQLPLERRKWVAARSISRNEFFAGLFILGCANGLLGRAIYTASLEGWSGAVVATEMNAIVLFACLAGLALLLGGRSDEPVRPMDVGVGVIFLPLVILPIFALSWVAVTGLGLYILLFANEQSERRRGALILLTLAVPMLWSWLFFQFFAKPILDIDATMVSWILGTERIGNLVAFKDGSGYMLVSPACTSFANISFAFLCWITVSQWAGRRWSSVDLFWPVLACASVVAVNVGRIAITGLGHDNYEFYHNEWGEMVGGFITLTLLLGISLLGARRELFHRA